jgi:hypothetical protein
MFRTTALTAALPVTPELSTRTIALATAALGIVVSTASAARADIITENLGGMATSGPLFIVGQSLVTPAGGPWNNLTFNFFSDVPPTTPTAAGTAFLLSKEYQGTPNNLNSSTPGFLAASTGIVGGQYTFAPSVTVQPNTTYWVYENVEHVITGGNSVSATVHLDVANDPNESFFEVPGSSNFLLSGDSLTSPVPAPPAVVLVGLGAGCVVLKRYVHRRATA